MISLSVQAFCFLPWIPDLASLNDGLQLTSQISTVIPKSFLLVFVVAFFCFCFVFLLILFIPTRKKQTKKRSVKTLKSTSKPQNCEYISVILCDHNVISSLRN